MRRHWNLSGLKPYMRRSIHKVLPLLVFIYPTKQISYCNNFSLSLIFVYLSIYPSLQIINYISSIQGSLIKYSHKLCRGGKGFSSYFHPSHIFLILLSKPQSASEPHSSKQPFPNFFNPSLIFCSFSNLSHILLIFSYEQHSPHLIHPSQTLLIF